MVISSRTNRDLSFSPDMWASGRPLTFGESVAASYDASIAAKNMLSDELAMFNAEGENRKVFLEYGEEPPPSLDTVVDPDAKEEQRSFPIPGVLLTTYRDYIEARREQETVGFTVGRASLMTQDRDKKILDFRAKHPEAKVYTYNEMYEAHKKQQREALTLEENARGLGSFVGSFAGGVHPKSSPLAFASLFLPLGGGSLAARVAIAGVSQGAAEAASGYAGAWDTQSAAGIEPHPLTDVLYAAGGGALFQGAGELALAGARGVGKALRTRRAIRGRPLSVAAVGPEEAGAGVVTAPAPATPPVLAKRALTSHVPQTVVDQVNRDMPIPTHDLYLPRARQDFDVFERQLASFDGPTVARITPPTATAALTVPEIRAPSVKVTNAGATLDEIARMYDPEVFRLYDKFADRINEIRGWIAEINARDVPHRNESALAAEVDALEQRIAVSPYGVRKKLEKRLAVLRDEFEATRAERRIANTALLRSELQDVDAKMRDLAPAVSRAYAHAQGQWKLDQGNAARVARMVANASKSLPEPDPVLDKALNEVLTQGPKLPAGVQTHTNDLANVGVTASSEPLAKVLHASADEGVKMVEAAGDTVMQAVRRALADENATEIALPGGNKSVKLDAVAGVTEDGKDITVREMLRRAEKDDTLDQAILTCRT